MSNITLVMGGGRSGKSTFAEQLALRLYNDKSTRYYIATAEAFDSEMQHRIIKHKERRKDSFITIEESIQLSKTIKEIENNASCILIECLSVWLGNILYYRFKNNESKEDKKDREIFMNNQIDSLINCLKQSLCPIILVSNETNLEAFFNDDEESQLFIKTAEEINSRIAKLADSVYFCVAGIPLKIK